MRPLSTVPTPARPPLSDDERDRLLYSTVYSTVQYSTVEALLGIGSKIILTPMQDSKNQY